MKLFDAIPVEGAIGQSPNWMPSLAGSKFKTRGTIRRKLKKNLQLYRIIMPVHHLVMKICNININKSLSIGKNSLILL